MEIKKFILGYLKTNCYLIIDGNKAVIIDPGFKPSYLIQQIGNLNVCAILLTHGHFDHIGACDDLFKKYQCPIYVSKDDLFLLKDPSLNMSFNNNIKVNSPVMTINKDILIIDDFIIKVHYTSGHTKGSVVYEIGDFLFTGDTLFYESVGRTDLPTGSQIELTESLKIFKKFKHDYLIYPGHDKETTLYHELNKNIFL